MSITAAKRKQPRRSKSQKQTELSAKASKSAKTVKREKPLTVWEKHDGLYAEDPFFEDVMEIMAKNVTLNS